MSDFEEIEVAIQNDNIGKVRELIANGIDINQSYIDDQTPLGLAAYLGHIDIVLVLLESEADVNLRMLSEGETALMSAAMGGSFEVVQALVQAGAEIDIQDYQGNTAISFAEANGYPEIVEYLSSRL